VILKKRRRIDLHQETNIVIYVPDVLKVSTFD